MPAWASQFYFEQPLFLFAKPAADGSPGSLAIGDVNGDGLNDIVSAGSEPANGATPASFWMAIALQRRGGFDFAVRTPMPCGANDIHLVETDPDRGLEIIARCERRTYSENWFGFIVMDMKADGSVRTQALQYDVSMFSAKALSIADLNQDGRDDILYTFLDENSPSGLDYRYTVWYNRGGGAFDVYRSDLFRFTGIDETRKTGYIRPYPWPLDMDGDGSTDILQGLCEAPCLSRQEPWKQMLRVPLTTDSIDSPPGDSATNNYYGDLDGDGLPDRIMDQFGHDTVYIQLQTAENRFSDVARLSPVALAGDPKIVDLDLNGLADIIVPTETVLVYAMQDSPGQFRVVSQTNTRGLMGASLYVADLNGDLCPDLLTRTVRDSPYSLPDAYQLIRGMNCVTPGDLAVAVQSSNQAVDIAVSQVGGARTFVDAVLRVDIAPATRGADQWGLAIQAPAGCRSVPARAPRRLFDCVLAPIAPGQSRKLRFGVSFKSTSSPLSQLQAIAFLRESVGDGNPSNDRARDASLIERRLRHTESDTPGPPSPGEPLRPGAAERILVRPRGPAAVSP
jgi:hypothetical protein